MARAYKRTSASSLLEADRRRAWFISFLTLLGVCGVILSPLLARIGPWELFFLGFLPAIAFAITTQMLARQAALESERERESTKRGGKKVLGAPPDRSCFIEATAATQAKGKAMIDKYLVGFDLDSGEPLWIDEDDLCGHGCVFAKTGVGKTLWLESLIFQQMLRGRASGCTFIDAKRDSGTLAHIILMALISGRIEDLIVIDPFDPLHAYNFVMTGQRADVKARKVLRAGLPPTSDQSVTKHYDRLAADSIYRMVRAMESFGLAWSIRDIAVSLSAFHIAYPHLRTMLNKIGAKQAMVELGHLAASYRTAKGALDTTRITDNLRGIASELHAIAGSEMGDMFCTKYTDLVLTDAIMRGKIIYFMLPRLEEAESAARMVKVFREDLEVSIGEITSSRHHRLEDPHLVVVDEGSSTFGPTWANLFELARKGRFALLFGAQSTGGLTDAALGLSEAFYERVMANVNLKVMMRIGDNRTAMEMTEWIGKVTTTKKSIGTGVTLGRSAAEMKGPLDFTARSTGGESHTISISEDEEDLVSSEELKHEMSAEKGLAWFDLGDGRIRKGRAFWFDAQPPEKWEGREFIVRLDRHENDEIGLAEWVDEQILSQEERETSGRPPAKEASESDAEQKPVPEQKPAVPPGPFRIGAVPGARRGRAGGIVSVFGEEKKPAAAPTAGAAPVAAPAPAAVASSTPPAAGQSEAQPPPAPRGMAPKVLAGGKRGPEKPETKQAVSRK